MLQLHKSCTNCGNVRLLITERHTSSSLRIFQFGVDVDSSIANASVQSIHNQGQFNCTRKPTTRKRDNNEKTFNNDKKRKEKRRWSSSSYARIDLSIGLLCIWSPYPLSTDVVRRQQRLFCEGLVAEKHLERSQRQTISTALFVLAYPGSRMGNVKVISLELFAISSRRNGQYLDCRWRNAEIQFIFFLHTSLDQLLHRVLFLHNEKQKEWVFCL